MNYSLENKYKLIKEDLLKIKSSNTIKIIKEIMNNEYIDIHGPEHHFLDGGAFLTAYLNATNQNEKLSNYLDELAKRSIKMPGAICGNWGVCGASASIGAALAIINSTTPLTNNEYYQHNMVLTSNIIKKMSTIGGPRCCKRNAFISISMATEFVKDKYNINLENEKIYCDYSNLNQQCIHNRCPYYKKKIAFICVHNSCRSQIAETLCRVYRPDLDTYSAGTEIKPQINQDAVRIMKNIYNIDMSRQYSKLITDIPSCDINISMGCNVTCPFVEKGFDDDFGILDPTGKDDTEFIKVIEEIKAKILNI